MGIRMCLDEPDVSVIGPVHDVLPPREVHEVRLADSSSSPVSDTSCYDLLPLKLGVGERLRDPRKPCVKILTQPCMCALLSRLSPSSWEKTSVATLCFQGSLQALLPHPWGGQADQALSPYRQVVRLEDHG